MNTSGRIAGALGLLAGLLLIGNVIAGLLRESGKAPRDPAPYLILGSTQPRLPGDSATVCAVDTSGGRWQLYEAVYRVRILTNGHLVIWQDRAPRTACRPLLWERGISADTLPVVRRPWTLYQPRGNEHDTLRRAAGRGTAISAARHPAGAVARDRARPDAPARPGHDGTPLPVLAADRRPRGVALRLQLRGAIA